MKIPLDVLFRIPARARESQVLFSWTGGAHAAALFDTKGNLQAVREDVGRHNALDKLLGHALLAGVATGESGIFLSGRVSLELIIKVVRARVPLVAAVSAPTAAAVQAADRLGITLCGFVRGNEVSVYANGWRIVKHYDFSPHEYRNHMLSMRNYSEAVKQLPGGVIVPTTTLKNGSSPCRVGK